MNFDEKEYDKIVNYLIGAKTFLGMGKTNIEEVTSWAKNIILFLEKYKSYFNTDGITIDDLCYILQNKKQFVMDVILKDLIIKGETKDGIQSNKQTT